MKIITEYFRDSLDGKEKVIEYENRIITTMLVEPSRAYLDELAKQPKPKSPDELLTEQYSAELITWWRGLTDTQRTQIKNSGLLPVLKLLAKRFYGKEGAELV